MTRTIEQMISSEVLCCMSHIVATVAKAYGAEIRSGFAPNDRDVAELAEQAFELACPIDDYEEAALQDGWRVADDGAHFIDRDGLEAWADPRNACGWEDLCRERDIEPYQAEVFEHWAVTDWLADKLEAAGEKVDRDFAGLCVWARTTTGQAIYADAVIERIYAETHKA